MTENLIHSMPHHSALRSHLAALFRLLPAFSLAAALGFSATAVAAETKAKPAPDPALAPIVDVAGLPRVLLIGDSISIGYTLPVREALKGKANVHRPAGNCSSTG